MSSFVQLCPVQFCPVLSKCVQFCPTVSTCVQFGWREVLYFFLITKAKKKHLQNGPRDWVVNETKVSITIAITV